MATPIINDDLLEPRAPGSRPGDPAWNVALLFPRQGYWTEDEYLALESNRLVELSDGHLEVPSMPSIGHQLIVRFLFEQLHAFVRCSAAGLVLFAPLPVHLWHGQFREPDVVYLRPGRQRNRGKYPEGADLVIEVVSEGTEDRERDLVIKREKYARASIPEYWIVDPELRIVTVLTLEGESYRLHGEFKPGQQAASVLLNGFSIAVEAVFAAADEQN